MGPAWIVTQGYILLERDILTLGGIERCPVQAGALLWAEGPFCPPPRTQPITFFIPYYKSTESTRQEIQRTFNSQPHHLQLSPASENQPQPEITKLQLINLSVQLIQTLNHFFKKGILCL